MTCTALYIRGMNIKDLFCSCGLRHLVPLPLFVDTRSGPGQQDPVTMATVLPGRSLLGCSGVFRPVVSQSINSVLNLETAILSVDF